MEPRMTDDPRCCGSGTCIIDGAGRCWCGQQWDGQKMCQPPLPAMPTPSLLASPAAAGAVAATPWSEADDRTMRQIDEAQPEACAAGDAERAITPASAGR
jgi:hypothetical protein